MSVVDFGNNHRNVGSPTVSRVIGNHGDFRLSISLLKRLYLVLFHINSAEYKADKLCHLTDVCCIVNYHILILIGHRSFHFPSVSNCLCIRLSCRTGGSRKSGYLKIRVIFKQGEKTLTNHTGCADHTDFHFFHSVNSFQITIYTIYYII